MRINETVGSDDAADVGPRVSGIDALRLGATDVRLVALGTAVGALLRFATLDAKGYWEDEIATVNVVAGSPSDLWATLRETEGTPPLFYVLAWVWSQAFGTGEVGLRSLSAAFGTAAIPVAYAAGRTLVTPRVGVVAALLVALNPLLVWYSQEARAHALLVLLGGASFALAARAVERAEPRRLAVWAAAASLTLATHYYGGFLVGAECAWLLAAVRPRRRVAGAVGAVAAVAAALVPLAAVQSRGGSRASWIAEIDLVSRVVELPGILLVGLEAPRPVLLAGAAALLASAAIWTLARRATSAERRGAVVAAVVVLAAVGSPLVLAVGGLDYFIYKHMLATAIPAIVVLAAGFGARRGGRFALGSLAGLCALSLAVVVATATEPKYGREDWRTAAQVLGTPSVGRAVVATPGRSHASPLAHYLAATRLEAGAALVAEIAVVAMARRPLGAIAEPRVPAVSSQPRAPAGGFRLVQRVEDEHFTLLLYRAAEPTPVAARTLVAAAIGRERGETVLVQRGRP